MLQHDVIKRSIAEKQQAFGSFQEAVKRLEALVVQRRDRVK